MKKAIGDNVLDAFNEGRWSKEEMVRVLGGGPMSREMFDELKRKERKPKDGPDKERREMEVGQRHKV